MTSPLQNNITNLQELLEQVNNLPDAGVELPELSNPAEVTEVFSGAEYIDETGAKKTGTFTIDSELSAQDDLIAQIQAVVDGLPEAGGGDSGGGSVDTCTVTINRNNLSMIFDYSASCYSNGQYNSVTDGYYYGLGSVAGYSTLTLENVICGSLIYVYTNSPIIPAYSAINGSEVLFPTIYTAPYVWCIKVTSSPNVNEIITLRDDD